MNKGVKLRLIIHNILYDIYVHNKTVDNAYQKNKIGVIDERDRSIINNICLNTMRFYFHSKKILRNFVFSICSWFPNYFNPRNPNFVNKTQVSS